MRASLILACEKAIKLEPCGCGRNRQPAIYAGCWFYGRLYVVVEVKFVRLAAQAGPFIAAAVPDLKAALKRLF